MADPGFAKRRGKPCFQPIRSVPRGITCGNKLDRELHTYIHLCQGSPSHLEFIVESHANYAYVKVSSMFWCEITFWLLHLTAVTHLHLHLERYTTNLFQCACSNFGCGDLFVRWVIFLIHTDILNIKHLILSRYQVSTPPAKRVRIKK